MLSESKYKAFYLGYVCFVYWGSDISDSKWKNSQSLVFKCFSLSCYHVCWSLCETTTLRMYLVRISGIPEMQTGLTVLSHFPSLFTVLCDLPLNICVQYYGRLLSWGGQQLGTNSQGISWLAHCVKFSPHFLAAWPSLTSEEDMKSQCCTDNRNCKRKIKFPFAATLQGVANLPGPRQ